MTFSAPKSVSVVWALANAEERELIYESHFRGTRPSDPWVSTSNGVDFQHLRTLHGLPVVDPAAVTVSEHSIEYRIESPVVVQEGRITGVNTFSQHLAIGDQHMFMLFSGAPIAQLNRQPCFSLNFTA